jgi:uncharacterized alkaline shock family protein YloU
MEGHAVISSDILARYAADAATGVSGVRGLVPSPMHRHKGVRVVDDGTLRVELHLAVDWGTSIPQLGREVQARVREYLSSMANANVVAVEVVVDEVGPPTPAP